MLIARGMLNLIRSPGQMRRHYFFDGLKMGFDFVEAFI